MPLRTEHIELSIIDPPSDEDPIVAHNRACARISPNAAEAYLRAMAAYASPPNLERYVFPGLNEVSRGTLPEWAADWVFINAETITQLEAASRVQGCGFGLAWCWYGGRLFPVSDEHGSRNTELRTLSTLCCVAARLAAGRGEWATLTRMMRVVDRLGRHMFQQTTLHDMLIGSVACTHAHFMVDAIIRRNADAEPDWAAFADALAPLAEPLPSVAHMWRNELALARWSIRHSPRRTLRSWFRSRRRDERKQIARYQTVLAWIEQPIHDACDCENPARRALFKRMPKTEFTIDVGRGRIKRRVEPDGTVNETVTLNPNDGIRVSDYQAMCRPFELYLKTVAMRAGLVTLLALLAHRTSTGDWPSSLDELSPSAPPDPFTGRPLIYRRTAEGMTLYSVGWNCRDDGGAHRWDFGESEPGDYVFWPPPPIMPSD